MAKIDKKFMTRDAKKTNIGITVKPKKQTKKKSK